MRDSAVRELFDSTFRFETRQTDAPMAVPQPPKNHPPTGAAFDYLARFWLKLRHPDAATYPWQAENGILKLHAWAADDQQYGWRALAALKSFESAEREYEAYISTGNPTDDLLRAVLRLAELDAAYRGNQMAAAGVGVEPPDVAVADLRALWNVMVEGDLADIRPPMQLNPEFGAATGLVRGADADIIAGEALIEIKTAKRPTFTLEHFRQLAGYATLQKLAGRPDFQEMGVYLARYGKLLTVDADVIYGAPAFGEFLEKFQHHAEEMFGPRKCRTGVPG